MKKDKKSFYTEIKNCFHAGAHNDFDISNEFSKYIDDKTN